MSKMEKKRPNKRKSLADLNTKPKKIQRTTSTPVSQKINSRSFKPTNVKNGKQVNRNIPSNNKIQFTQVNKRNGKQNTNINQKKFKQNEHSKIKKKFVDENVSDEEAECEEEDTSDRSDSEIDNEDIEIDEEADSAEESQNGDNGDSDDEDVELEESSDEEATINNEANSDEESDNVEANSDNEIENANADSAEESQNDDNADSGDEDVELEENSDEEADIGDDNSDKETDNDKEVEIDQESDSEDNDNKDDVNEVENKVQKPIEAEYTVLLEGGSPNVHMQNIFKDCKINTFKIIVNQSMIKLMGTSTAVVNFDDEESVKKAVAKNGKTFDHHTITVKKITEEPYTPDFTPFFTHGYSRLFVIVDGLDSKTRVDKFLWDCKIISYDRFRDRKSNTLNDIVCVYFDDEESVEKALKRNKTVSTGKTISVRKGEEIKFKIHISGLTPESRIWHIFRDCHIRLIQSKTTLEKKFTGHALVDFINAKSMKKALAKNGTEHNGSVLTIESYTEYQKRVQEIKTKKISKINPKVNKDGEKIPQFSLFVKGLGPKARINNIFNDCEIESVKLFTNIKSKQLKGSGLVNFKDNKSFQRALLKNGTIHQGSVITVERKRSSAQNVDIMKKKMLLNEMIYQVRKLEQEIYKKTKPK